MINFPDDATGVALKRICVSGSDMSKPMAMDFFVAVPSEEAGNQAASKIGTLGFETSVEKDAETNGWTCYCSKSLIPHYEDVVRIENQLDEFSKPFGGSIDGFGTFGNV